MSTPHLPRDEVEAALGARRELGPETEPAVIDSFVDRMERAIEARVDERIAAKRPGAVPTFSSPAQTSSATRLSVVSLAMAVPLSAIAGGIGDLPGLIVA